MNKELLYKFTQEIELSGRSALKRSLSHKILSYLHKESNYIKIEPQLFSSLYLFITALFMMFSIARFADAEIVEEVPPFAHETWNHDAQVTSYPYTWERFRDDYGLAKQHILDETALLAGPDYTLTNITEELGPPVYYYGVLFEQWIAIKTEYTDSLGNVRNYNGGIRSWHNVNCLIEPKTDLHNLIPSVPRWQSCVVECPKNFGWNEAENSCNECPPGSSLPGCEDPELGEPECPAQATAGNPILMSIGNKYQIENDYFDAREEGLSFNRYYNSTTGSWAFSYTDRLKINTVTIFYNRADGKRLKFKLVGSTWLSETDPRLSLVNDSSGNWILSSKTDLKYTFDSTGHLTSISNLEGLTQTLAYDLSAAQGGDDNLDTLDTVSDSNGYMMSFSYDSQERIIQMTDPENGVYRYSYNTDGMLQYVSYPDTTNLSGSNPFGEDNPFITYHYEKNRLPKHLTGITDTLGDRFASWDYDRQGRAISSEHAGGAELTNLDYSYIDDEVDPRITVTNELGKQTTYHYTTINGVRKVTQVEGHSTANCAAANQSYTYDANGFMDLVSDWEGNITDYDHNDRGLEVQRIEAKDTQQERVITTQWHTDYRLPVKITEPDRVIDFTYDTNGLLLERKETSVP